MYRRIGLLLFAAGWGANHFGTMLIVYRSQLGLVPSKLAVLFGVYALGLIPGLIVAGRLSDRIGRRAVVLPASIAAAAASVFLSFGAYGFPVLLLGRLFYGLAMGSIMSPGSVWVQELSTDDHALGPRRATFALSAGFGLGPLLTGLLIEFGPAPLVVPYVAHAATTAIALFGAREVPETAKAKAAASDEGPKTSALRLLIGQLPVAPWAFAFPAVSIAILPNLMRTLVSRPAIYTGFVIATMLLCGLLVQPLTSRLGARGDLVGLVIGSIGLVLSAYSIRILSPAVVFVAGVFLGAAYGLVITTGLREVSTQVSSRARGTAVGVYYVLTYIGFGLPFVHAIAAKSSDNAAPLEWTAAVAIGCAVIRALTRRAFSPAS